MKDVCLSRCRGSMRGNHSLRCKVAYAMLVLLVAPEVAQADGIATTFMGMSFSDDPSNKARTVGLSLASMTGGVVGFELDFGRTNTSNNFMVDGQVTTVTGNIILGIPIKAVRPYVLAGVGWLRTKGEVSGGASTKHEGLGIDFGAGLMGFFTEHVGARVDWRHFRAGRNSGDFLGFEFDDAGDWRLTVGLALRF